MLNNALLLNHNSFYQMEYLSHCFSTIASGRDFSYYSSPSGVTLLPINPFNRTVTRHGKYRFADRAMTARNMLMSIKEQTLMTPYLQFDRNQWAALRDSVPMTLSEDEIARLKGINEDLSLEEVAGSIYLCHVC